MGLSGFVGLTYGHSYQLAGWVGHCTLGFAFTHGSIKPSLHQPPVNLTYLHARWTRSVFQRYDYLAALFVPSVGTTDIIVKVEALTNFTKQALLDSTKAIKTRYRHEPDSQQVP